MEVQGFRYMEVSGTPFEMGYQYGSSMDDAIHMLAQERINLWLKRRKGLTSHDALSIARASLDVQKEWKSSIHEEFLGIAEGAKIDPALLLIANGYTDLVDIKGQEIDGGCTSFALEREVTANGQVLAGQTWDMHSSAQEYLVLIRRKPEKGFQTLSLTTAGCLTLVGMNSNGLAMGNNNIAANDARPGVIYLSMLHAAMGEKDGPSAEKVFIDAPRASGHHYFIADRAGFVMGVETSGLHHGECLPNRGIYVHANHFKTPMLQKWAKSQPSAGSLSREKRLTRILEEGSGSIDVPFLKKALADREGTDELDRICRHGKDSRTCAAIIIEPEEERVWVVAGPPDMGTWYQLTM